MSAQGLYENTIAAQENLAVSFRLLLGLYLIIPLCLSLQFSDALFWGHYLRDNLPSSPTHFILFSLFFGTPHIIASALLLTTNREYFGFYKHKVLTSFWVQFEEVILLKELLKSVIHQSYALLIVISPELCN
jgi:hypothetical protein